MSEYPTRAYRRVPEGRLGRNRYPGFTTPKTPPTRPKPFGGPGIHKDPLSFGKAAKSLGNAGKALRFARVGAGLLARASVPGIALGLAYGLWEADQIRQHRPRATPGGGPRPMTGFWRRTHGPWSHTLYGTFSPGVYRYLEFPWWFASLASTTPISGQSFPGATTNQSYNPPGNELGIWYDYNGAGVGPFAAQSRWARVAASQATNFVPGVGTPIIELDPFAEPHPQIRRWSPSVPDTYLPGLAPAVVWPIPWRIAREFADPSNPYAPQRVEVRDPLPKKKDRTKRGIGGPIRWPFNPGLPGVEPPIVLEPGKPGVGGPVTVVDPVTGEPIREPELGQKPRTGGSSRTTDRGTHRQRRDKKAREKKLKPKGYAAYMLAGNVFGGFGEFYDTINALWKSLPKEKRSRSFYKGKPIRPGWRKRWADVYQNFDDIDWNRAIKNYVAMQIDDMAIGMTDPGKAYNKATGRPYGSPSAFSNLDPAVDTSNDNVQSPGAQAIRLWEQATGI